MHKECVGWPRRLKWNRHTRSCLLLSLLFCCGQSQTLWAGLSDRFATLVLRTRDEPQTLHHQVAWGKNDPNTAYQKHEELHQTYICMRANSCMLVQTCPPSLPHLCLVHVQFAFEHPCQRGAARGTRVAALAVFLQAAVAVLEMHFEGRRGRCFFGRFVGFAGNV